MADVEHYYDTNTASFLRFGQGGDEGAIHRAIWGPGVKSAAEAFHFVEAQIVARLASIDAPRVLDLGCGVGGSLIELARRSPDLTGVGVTLSEVQVELARRRVTDAKLDHRVDIKRADFTRLPDLGTFDLAFAIEAFALGPDPQAFFEQAFRSVRPGGWLVVCDDMLAETIDLDELPEEPSRWLSDFRRGWQVQSLMRPSQIAGLASLEGWTMTNNRDLTAWIELRRPRDRLIAAVVTLGRGLPMEHPRWLNLVGGHALQCGLLGGVLEHRLLTFSR